MKWQDDPEQGEFSPLGRTGPDLFAAFILLATAIATIALAVGFVLAVGQWVAP